MNNYPLLHEHKGIQYRRGVPDDHVVVDAADVTTCLARIAALESDLATARKERDDALTCLEALSDIQNGSPLIRDTDEWERIMFEARRLISAVSRPDGATTP